MNRVVEALKHGKREFVERTAAMTAIKIWLPLLTFGAVLAGSVYAITRRGRAAALRDLRGDDKARGDHRGALVRTPGQEPVVELELQLDGIFDGDASVT
ncbi:MAG TPA: hypothetical protein VK745_07440 [Polyangiaceae bacterium]|nr:hypothetical protein [Polyangiaceae bacterium]